MCKNKFKYSLLVSVIHLVNWWRRVEENNEEIIFSKRQVKFDQSGNL